MPSDALLMAPAGDGLITPVGEIVTRFLMAPELSDAALALQGHQHGQGFAHTHHQRLAKLSEGLA